MCLTLCDRPRVRTAKQDIVVWKVLRIKQKNWKSQTVSPYQDKVYSRGRTYRMLSQLQIRHSYWLDRKKIEEGFHSFTSHIDAQDLIRECFMHSEAEKHGVYMFIIPKGSKYYTGTWKSWAGIASNTIKMATIKQERNYFRLAKPTA